MSIEKALLTILAIFILYLIYRIIKFLRDRDAAQSQDATLPLRVIRKADWKYQKLLSQFRKRYHRNPKNDEEFRIIINASHITIRRKGFKGHWGRQKVRKYLLEKHNVVDKYTMR